MWARIVIVCIVCIFLLVVGGIYSARVAVIFHYIFSSQNKVGFLTLFTEKASFFSSCAVSYCNIISTCKWMSWYFYSMWCIHLCFWYLDKQGRVNHIINWKFEANEILKIAFETPEAEPRVVVTVIIIAHTHFSTFLAINKKSLFSR